MRFQVPQFIEVEDKIFGPLTLKQFIYIAGSGGVAFVLFTTLPRFIAVALGGPVIAFALALSFYKVNNRPFINIVESFLRYSFSHKLYIWKKNPKKIKKEAAEKKPPQIHVPKLSESKLKDLSWSLDIKESLYSGVDQQK